MELFQEKSWLELLEIMEQLQENSLEQVKVVAHELVTKKIHFLIKILSFFSIAIIFILIFATIYSWHVSIIFFFGYIGNKKGQWATRNLNLAKLFTKERFPIIWKKGRLVEKYSTVFKSECTVLIRQISMVPLTVKD